MAGGSSRGCLVSARRKSSGNVDVKTTGVVEVLREREPEVDNGTVPVEGHKVAGVKGRVGDGPLSVTGDTGARVPQVTGYPVRRSGQNK